MKLKAIIFLLGALLWTACGYELPKTTNGADNSANSAALANQNTKTQSNDAGHAEQANKNAETANSKIGKGEAKLILSNSGEAATYPCNGGEVEIDESVTASNYSLTGECKKLTVDGVSVTVNVEKVGEIVVKGTSNKVVYGEGIGGKKPKITKSGVSTAVDSRKSSEEKKAKESQTQ